MTIGFLLPGHHLTIFVGSPMWIPWSPSPPVQVSLLREEVGKLTQVPEPIQVDHVATQHVRQCG